MGEDVGRGKGEEGVGLNFLTFCSGQNIQTPTRRFWRSWQQRQRPYLASPLKRQQSSRMASMPVVPMSVAQAQVAGDYQIKSEAALPVLGASDPPLRACSSVSAHDAASLRARPCLPASLPHL